MIDQKNITNLLSGLSQSMRSIADQTKNKKETKNKSLAEGELRALRKTKRPNTIARVAVGMCE